MTLNNMAMVHGTKGNYDEALAFYGRALTIYETTLGLITLAHCKLK